jgi:hypothetical protein
MHKLGVWSTFLGLSLAGTITPNLGNTPDFICIIVI